MSGEMMLVSFTLAEVLKSRSHCSGKGIIFYKMNIYVRNGYHDDKWRCSPQIAIATTV